MAWINPKTNWVAGDGIMASDLNRIEENTNLIRNAMPRSFSFGGKAEDITVATNHPYIVAMSMINLRPEYRTFINLGGVYPTRTFDSAFIVLRNDPYTSVYPTWAQLTNGAIDSIDFSVNPIIYPLPSVNTPTECCAIVGFVNTNNAIILKDYHQIYATVTPYPNA